MQRFVEIVLHVAQRDARSFGQRLGEGEGLLLQLGVVDHAVDEANLLAALSADLLGSEHQLARPHRADGARQQPGDSVVSRKADLGVAGGAEGRFRRDADVAGKRDREARAGRGAGQRRNGRLAHRDQRAGEMRLPPAQVGQPLLVAHLAARAAAAHALHVAAAAEGGAGAGDQKGAHGIVVAARLDLVAQRLGEVGRHRVACLGAVQRDQRDAVADAAQEFCCAGIDFHVTFSLP